MAQQTVFSYDPDSKVYIGETLADEDLENPGEFLYPAHTTTVEPLADADIPAGHVQFWNGQEWAQRPVNVPVPLPTEEDTPEARTARAEAIVQNILDSLARSMGYDSALTAVSYAEEPAVPRFQQEGQRIRRLRSLMWGECYAILAEIKAGAPWLSDGAFIARMPTYDEVVIMEQQTS